METTLQLNETMDPAVFELKATNDQLFRVVADLKKVIHQRDATLNEMIEAHFEGLYLLAMGADFREGRNGLRLVRVGVSAEVIARAAGMPDDYCTMIRRAASLHDIGLVTLPDSLLRKQEEFDDKEWQLWKSHTEIGARILSSSFDSPLLQMASEIALTHHEAFSGSGYPAKLSGEDIPLSGRIVALLEYFEKRTNKLDNPVPPRPTNEVLRMIHGLSGLRFDPRLVDLLEENVTAICAACDEVNQKANSFQELLESA